MNLMMAGMIDEPEQFVRRTFTASLYMSLGLSFILLMLFAKIGISLLLIPALLPLIFVMLFLYMLKYPDMIILKRQKQISREIVFAGRFLIIELESGVPLYETFINVAKNYEGIGIYFKEVIDKVNMGIPFEQALNEATEMAPSPDLRKIMWQVLNSMKTGSDVTKSLNAVIDQITREQKILVAEYGRKLNPLAMFYMMVAVIIPSLGMTLLMIMATFVGFQLSLTILLILAGFLGFMQFMFLSIIRSSRPPVDI
ncbi:type II secretion system F family protein [Candidatus Woesearchaeota archaeon]|nr:type II secretion system F family protein [Candidatus Woesearchaeota archaeon]